MRIAAPALPLLLALAVAAPSHPGLASPHGTLPPPGPPVDPRPPQFTPGDTGKGVGGAGPTTPGPNPPGAPAGPASPAPGGATPGSSPGLPTTPGGEAVDHTSWVSWWWYNRHPYLNVRARALEPDVVSEGDEEFYLGHGQRPVKAGKRAPRESDRFAAASALREILEGDAHTSIHTASLLALAKLGEEVGSGVRSRDLIRPYLTHSNQTVAEVAALSLGVLGDRGSAILLADLVEGNAPAQGEAPSKRTRAFAAFALGAMADRNPREDLRRFVASRLFQALAAGESRQTEIEVACVTALGLVPLKPDPLYALEGDARRSPASCRQAQVDWLLELVADPDRNHLVRAHAITASARLMEGVHQPAAWRERCLGELLSLMGPRSKAEREVVQSSILALGRLADSDEDAMDRRIREALREATARTGSPIARRFAMMSLAQASGLPGQGAGDPLSGLAGTRKRLLEQLGSGPSAGRSWAALALGVLERSLADRGIAPSADVELAVRSVLSDTRSPELVGACSIALGLMRDPEAIPLLLDRMTSVSDDQTLGYVVVALGMLNAREAVERIQELVRSARYRPLLLERAAIGLGLMGEVQLVPDLCAMLEAARSQASQASIASALGQIGDTRSVAPLIAMLRDESLTDGARDYAAVAIGRVCDRFLLPWNTGMSTGVNYMARTAGLTNSEGDGVLDVL